MQKLVSYLPEKGFVALLLIYNTTPPNTKIVTLWEYVMDV